MVSNSRRYPRVWVNLWVLPSSDTQEEENFDGFCNRGRPHHEIDALAQLEDVGRLSALRYPSFPRGLVQR